MIPPELHVGERRRTAGETLTDAEENGNRRKEAGTDRSLAAVTGTALRVSRGCLAKKKKGEAGGLSF